MLLHHALTDVDCNAGDSTRCGETFRLLSVHAGRGKPLLAFDSTQVQADGAAVRVWHMPLLEPAAEMCPAKCQCCWRLSQRRPAAVNTHMASANAGSILITVSHPTILPAAFVSLGKSAFCAVVAGLGGLILFTVALLLYRQANSDTRFVMVTDDSLWHYVTFVNSEPQSLALAVACAALGVAAGSRYIVTEVSGAATVRVMRWSCLQVS